MLILNELAIGSVSGFAYYPPSCAYSIFQTAGLPLACNGVHYNFLRVELAVDVR